MKRLKLGRRVVLFLQAPFALGLLLSSLAYLLNPIEYPWAGVLGLSFPFFLLIHSLFTLFWLIRLSRISLYSIVILLLFSIPHLHSTFQLSGERLESESMGSFKVMSYNVHFWNPVESITDKSPDSIVAFVKREDPDLFFAQEYRAKDQAHPLNYPYTVFFKNRGQSFGLAIFSKFKVVASGQEFFDYARGSYNSFIWADVEINGKTIRLINVQLVNTDLVPESYHSLGGNVDETLNSENLEEEGKDIYRRLTDSYILRAHQALQLSDFIQNSEHKVIVCGDFNDTPSSFSYDVIRGELRDAFIEAGSGTGDSYNKLKLIPLRIDYILVSEDFEVGSFHSHSNPWSDHKPISTQLSIRP